MERARKRTAPQNNAAVNVTLPRAPPTAIRRLSFYIIQFRKVRKGRLTCDFAPNGQAVQFCSPILKSVAQIYIMALCNKLPS